MGFIILKTFDSSSRFQCKNRFLKICPVAWVICQNVINFGLPNQTFTFHHNLIDISGFDAYFSKPIFALKSWAQIKGFEYNEAFEEENETEAFVIACHAGDDFDHEFDTIRISRETWESLKKDAPTNSRLGRKLVRNIFPQWDWSPRPVLNMFSFTSVSGDAPAAMLYRLSR